MVWLDGLDIQVVALLNASFAENAAEDVQPVTRPEGDSLARFGHNLLPVDWRPHAKTSPVFNYPYARSREALAALARNGDPDPCHGHKLRYVNPASGEWAMPTIGTFLQLLPAGFATRRYRATDAAVYVCVEGAGETRVGETVLRWEPRDVFVVPGWAAHTHHVSAESVLFSFSDRPVQEKLGLWREVRGNA
jgi:gentisate 1,2-dioxygenase